MVLESQAEQRQTQRLQLRGHRVGRKAGLKPERQKGSQIKSQRPGKTGLKEEKKKKNILEGYLDVKVISRNPKKADI